MKTARPASDFLSSGSMQRISWKFAVTLSAITSFHGFRSIWPSGEEGPATPALPTQDVELAVALVQRRAEPGDAVEIGEVERHQRGAAAVFTDLVVELFEAALGSRHRHDVRAVPGKRARGGIADAARGAGHEGDTGGEGLGMYSIISRPCRGTFPEVTRGCSRDKRGRNDVLLRGRLSSLRPAAKAGAAAARPGSGR